ncbi:hypothetical protein [Flavobacterium sp.]|jgi:hypothetical protein|uniref:hypothetical protein n=1 Tax=Flavobacterium sp. TaxID=239 RepID=UPI002A81CC37|nr:hypothetical protein [Flavobacterium sp.]
MKTIQTAIFLAIYMLTVQVNAQSSIQPFDTTIDYDKVQRPCIQVNLDPEPKTLKNAWKDYLKDNYDFKLKGIGFFSNKDLLSAEEITVNQISSNEINFYTHIVEDENGSEMKVFVRNGNGIYITKEKLPNEYAAVSEILNSFIKYYLPKYYGEKINDTEERINKLTEEKDDLKNNIDEKSSDIEKLKKEIKNNEEELKSKKKELEITEIKLKKRKEKLERIRTQLRKL